MTEDEKDMRQLALHQVGMLSTMNDLIRRQDDDAQKTLGDCLTDIGRAFDTFKEEAHKIINEHKKKAVVYEVWTQQEFRTLEDELYTTERRDDPEYVVVDNMTGEKMRWFDNLSDAETYAEAYNKEARDEQN